MYVGYLPLPRSLKTVLVVICSFAVATMFVAAALTALMHSDPGDAIREDQQRHTLSGTIITKPYPMIVAADRGDGKAGLVLVVESGKHGSAPRLDPFEGKLMSLAGNLLHRDDNYLLKLAEGADAIKLLEQRSPASPASVSMGRQTLRREVVDSKCYLGAMKPGIGNPHRTCAVLCLSGGIPPLVVTNDRPPRAYVISDLAGNAATAEIADFVAEPLEVSGEVKSLAGTLVLALEMKDVQRK